MPRELDDSVQRTWQTGDPGRAVLLGRDHTDPGAMATMAADARTAVGIARGWRPKPYAYVDPNEDAVAVVVDGTSQLLVVADGHNGHQASHVAVASVLEQFDGAVPAADLDDNALVNVVARADRAIAEVARPFGPRTRTTLVVALRTPDTVQWAGAGDSSLLVVEGMMAAELPTQTRWFCGDHLTSAQMRETLARGRVALGHRGWVVLVTDGYTDYLPVPRPPADATRMVLRGIDQPQHAADALLRSARRGGAGDNVGVSVSAPW